MRALIAIVACLVVLSATAVAVAQNVDTSAAEAADQRARACKKFSSADLFSNKCLISVCGHGHRPSCFGNM